MKPNIFILKFSSKNIQIFNEKTIQTTEEYYINKNYKKFVINSWDRI